MWRRILFHILKLIMFDKLVAATEMHLTIRIFRTPRFPKSHPRIASPTVQIGRFWLLQLCYIYTVVLINAGCLMTVVTIFAIVIIIPPITCFRAKASICLSRFSFFGHSPISDLRNGQLREIIWEAEVELETIRLQGSWICQLRVVRT